MESSFGALDPIQTGTNTDFFSAGFIGRLGRYEKTTDTDLDQAVERRLKAAQGKTMDLEAALLEDYGVELSRPSRKGFECFMQYNTLSLPMLGADPNGVVEATWSRGDEHLSIRFKDRHRLSYAVSFMDGGNRRRKWSDSSLATFFTDCPEARRIASA